MLFHSQWPNPLRHNAKATGFQNHPFARVTVIHRKGSHRKMKHHDGRHFTFAYHDKVDLTMTQLSQIAKQAGCKPEDLL